MQMKVMIPKHLVPGWWVVAYRIAPELAEHLREFIDMPRDATFNQVVTDLITMCFENPDKLPPDIAPTIYNLANDLMNGRDLMIRTGDYIAIQNHIKSNKLRV
jgi:hypothetical protein